MVLKVMVRLLQSERDMTKALEEYPDINVVFDGVGNWNAEDAMALTETWFSSREKIDGIVCMNDGMATGVRR